ncbi:MAG TPA: hypothetical protein VGL27_17345 [Negativicutes bacterium]
MENGITVKSVGSVYKKVLAGEPIDCIEAPDRIKHIVREFMKWSSLPASQIAIKSEVPLHIALELRVLNKHYKNKLTRAHTSGVVRSSDITTAVRRLLQGYTRSSIRSLGVSDEAINIARKCVKVLEAGGGTKELYKLGVSHAEAVSLIAFIEAHQLIAKPAIDA